MNATTSFETIRVGIVCPKGAKTGGPEALHQLCDSLTRLGVRATLINLGQDVEPVAEYAHYQADWASTACLSELDYLVIPETSLRIPKPISDSFKGRFIIWWLSVDNADEKSANNFERRTFPIAKEWPSEVNLKNFSSIGNQIANFRSEIQRFLNGSRRLPLEKAIHIAQSHYAQWFLTENHGLNSTVVSDYIRRSDVEAQTPLARTVVFNPAKGGNLLEAVRALSQPDITFVPLSNMSGDQVRNAMRKAALYIDLGHFPGRDRMPREAIALGCPVLIASRGAARFQQDFPLPTKFQIDLSRETPQTVANRIGVILAEGVEIVKQQDEFFQFVANDRERFDHEVKVWVSELVSARNNDN